MSALKPAGSTRRWRRIRAYVLERDAFACRFVVPDRPGGICGAYATHVHHVDPRATGGTDDPAKLAAACSDHNLAKGSEPGLDPREAAPRRQPRDRRRLDPVWKW